MGTYCSSYMSNKCIFTNTHIWFSIIIKFNSKESKIYQKIPNQFFRVLQNPGKITETHLHPLRQKPRKITVKSSSSSSSKTKKKNKKNNTNIIYNFFSCDNCVDIYFIEKQLTRVGIKYVLLLHQYLKDELAENIYFG